MYTEKQKEFLHTEGYLLLDMKELYPNEFTKAEKLSLITFLWDVAYADSILDVDEERLVRRIADLIRVKDIDVLKLKDRAKN